MIRRELEVEDLPLPGGFIIKPKEFYDERGAFYKMYDRAILRTRGVEPVFAEDCLAVSRKGVVRGMHYQLDPFSQAKLVCVVKGAVWDVIVDLRRSSPSFGKWFSVELTDQNRYSVYVPRGCAHGYLSLTEEALVSYQMDNDYAPHAERGIPPDDKTLAINWPKMNYVISEKDRSWPPFEKADTFA